MKLLFDESLSPKLVHQLLDLFPESEVRCEMDWQAPVIAGFWNTPPNTPSS
jgi:hypothetical protein